MCHMLCHKSLEALILHFLASWVKQVKHEQCTSSVATTTRTEAACGPAYSMATAIGATMWQWRSSPVDASICILPDSQFLCWNHSSHGPISSVATMMGLEHVTRWRECFHLFVPAARPAEHIVWWTSDQHACRPPVTCLLDCFSWPHLQFCALMAVMRLQLLMFCTYARSDNVVYSAS